MSTPTPLAPPPPDWEPAPARPAAATEPEPDWGPPLAPGELAELVVDGGGVRPEDLPPAERAALEARRAAARPAASPDRATLQERAQRILSARLGTLESILADTRADPADITRAMSEVRAIAGARTEAPKQARELGNVLQDMARALREHGYTVSEPAPGATRPGEPV